MASTSRYQSRVLSYLRHQSRQLRDRTLYRVRQSRQVLSWGMQIVLYPVYVLFQSGRLVGYRLQQAVTQVRPLLEAVKDDDFDPAVGAPPLRADVPLEKTLQYLESWGLPVTFSPVLWPALHHGALPSGRTEMDGDHLAIGASAVPNQPSLSQLVVHDAPAEVVNVAQVIRGVACLMEGQSLVLVDTQNRVLDILTPRQQLQLHRYMMFETANYYRSLRLRLAAQAARSHLQTMAGIGGWRFLPPPRPRRAMLAPVRKFWQLMGWMQTQPVAIAANLFRETALLPPQHQIGRLGGSGRSPRVTPSLPQSWLGLGLPGDVPPFQGNPQGAGRPSFVQRLLQSIGWQLAGGSRPTSTPSRASSTGLLDSNLSGSNLNSWFDPDFLGSEAWSEASAYGAYGAYGKAPSEFTGTGSQPQDHRAPVIPSLPTRQRWTPSWMVDGHTGDTLATDPAEMGQAVVDRVPLRSAAVGDQPDPGRAAQAGDGGAIATASAQTSKTNDPEANLMPTLLDTKATLVGYEKHPLEQLLEWIDTGLVWVETFATRVWSWLRKAFK